MSRGDKKQEAQQSRILSADGSAIILSPSSAPPTRLSLLELNEFTTKTHVSLSDSVEGIFDGDVVSWNAMDEIISSCDEQFLLTDSQDPNRDGVVLPTSVSSARGTSLSAIEMSPLTSNAVARAREQSEASDSGNGIEVGTDTSVPASQQQSPSNADLLGDLINF